MTGDIARPSRMTLGVVAAVLAVAALVVVIGPCGDDSGKPKRPAASSARRSEPAARPRSFLARLIPPPRGVLPAARVPSQIRRLVAGLPVERKVAQLLLVGFDGRDASAPFFKTLRRMDLGGVVVRRFNYGGTASLEALTEAVANAAAGRARQPPFVVAQQEGGEFSAFPDLPPGLLPGETGSAAEAAGLARRTARQLKRLGLNGVLGPVADVGAGGADSLGARAYSDETRRVRAYAAAVVGAYRREGMLSAPSHFPGIGAASGSTDDGPTQVGLDMEAIERRDLPPFRAAIRAGAPAVLVGHAGYAPDSFVVPASLSRAIATNVLRGGVAFRGIAITDDLEAGAITAGNTVPKAAVEAVRAGADMVYISGPETEWGAAYGELLEAVKSGRITLPRLNAAVTRIVTAKRELGLRNRIKPRPPEPEVAPVTPVAPVAPVAPAPPAAP